MSLFFSFDRIQLRHAGQKKGTHRLSCHGCWGNILLEWPHCCSLTPPLEPHLSRSSPVAPSLPPYPVTPQPPIPHLHFHPLASTHLFFLFFILYYLIYFSQNLPPRFEPTSHVGERATLKPPLATGESLFCHAFILASCECRPSHASGEPTGVQMTVLCSQTAMNNETEVRYEVADAGRG